MALDLGMAGLDVAAKDLDPQDREHAADVSEKFKRHLDELIQ